jgi:hypothetical protein
LTPPNNEAEKATLASTRESFLKQITPQPPAPTGAVAEQPAEAELVHAQDTKSAPTEATREEGLEQNNQA